MYIGSYGLRLEGNDDNHRHRVVDDWPQRLLADRAYREILERILDCHIAPGAFVSERSLAGELGLGIAATRARVGYQVAPITLRGVNDFFETWRIIGPEVARLASTRLTAEHRAVLASRPAPVETSSPEEVVAYAEFRWGVLLDAVDNSVLSDITRRLNKDLRRLHVLTYRHAARAGTSKLPIPGNHEDESVDPQEATRDYIDAVRENVIEWLMSETSLPDVALEFT